MNWKIRCMGCISLAFPIMFWFLQIFLSIWLITILRTIATVLGWLCRSDCRLLSSHTAAASLLRCSGSSVAAQSSHGVYKNWALLPQHLILDAIWISDSQIPMYSFPLARSTHAWSCNDMNKIFLGVKSSLLYFSLVVIFKWFSRCMFCSPKRFR